MCLDGGGIDKLVLGACRGTEFSVRPSQISYVLPGHGYKVADVLAVEQQAESSMDPDLLPMAWEVSRYISQRNISQTFHVVSQSVPFFHGIGPSDLVPIGQGRK